MVWRLQNDKGIGPYVAWSAALSVAGRDPNTATTDRALYAFVMSGDKYGKNKNDPYLRDHAILEARNIVSFALQPHPNEDFDPLEWRALPERTQDQYRFGFPTKSAGTAWFGSRRLKELAAEGYTLQEVPAGRTILSKSGRQVIFVPWGKRYTAPPKNFYEKYLGRRKMGSRGKKRRKR